MFQLQSEKITLIPLSLEQLLLLAKGRNDLEKTLGLQESEFELNTDDSFLAEFTEAISGYVIPLVTQHPDEFEWFTHWLIVDNASKLTVGGIGGTGLPNEKGQVMIGYFIDKKFEGHGYATEAVKRVSEWMFKNKDLQTIIADTPLDNLGSQKVLQKAGFEMEGEVEEGVRWHLTR